MCADVPGYTAQAGVDHSPDTIECISVGSATLALMTAKCNANGYCVAFSFDGNSNNGCTYKVATTNVAAPAISCFYTRIFHGT